MDPGHDEVASRFTHDLVRLHQMAGKPSYSTFERVSKHQLRRATVSDVLNGKRVKLPEWRFVSLFVTACRDAAEESGLDPQELGTVADWKYHWDDATTGLIDARFPGHSRTVTAAPQSAEGRPEGVPTSGPFAASPPEPVSPAAAPSRPPPIWGPVPRRIKDFVGRERLLENLNRTFVQDSRRSALAIQGLAGVGKTRLAIEYAHRYAAQYDLVWWISCRTRELARRGMVGLESRLGLTRVPAYPGEMQFAGVFETLRLGQPYERWLLIFDHAEEPDKIKDLIPPRRGHILITSRNNRWEASEELIELDVFTRHESVEFLLQQIRGLSEANAQRLADAIGDLPLVLEHAAESRISADEYLTQLEESPVRLFSANQPSGYPMPVADAWRTVIDQLRAEAPAAMDLLRCLAFFGSGPIPLESLERGRYLQDISLHTLLCEPIERSLAIGALGRTGLLRISPATRTLQTHRLTQRIVRALTRDEAERCRHDVHLLLAAADPGNPGDSDNWPRYDELHGHMSPSDVEGCEDSTVRRLVINIVRYLHAVGEPAAARDLAERALARWAEADTKDADSSAIDLAMRQSRVAALFSLGEHEKAFDVSRKIFNEMHSVPNKWLSETVSTGNMAGTIFRIRGDFAAALDADIKSAEKHISHFENDHPDTFVTKNNLAMDHALNGNYKKAVQIGEDVHLSCRAFYGRDDHSSVLFYQNSLGRSKRLSGLYRDALNIAEIVDRGYDSIIEREILNEDHPWALMQKIDLAAARRDMGLSDTALDEVESEIDDVHQRCWRALGVDHQQTLAAAVTRGSVLRRIAGRIDKAEEVVADAERRYGSILGADHPYTYACTMTLAGIRRQMGAPEEAVSPLENVIAGLKRTLGVHHHYTLDAVAALVNALADAGEVEVAVTRGLEALSGYTGVDQPHALACTANTASVLSALGREGEAAALVADTLGHYLRALSDEHPYVKLVASGVRSDPDFTPLPL